MYILENLYDLQGCIEVLEPMRNSPIPLAAHIRGEGTLLTESLAEVIALAEELHVPFREGDTANFLSSFFDLPQAAQVP